MEADGDYTPTPLVSLAILEHNAHHEAKADGVLLTPSHNPRRTAASSTTPTGGPANARITRAIEERANALLQEGLKGVKRLPSGRPWPGPSLLTTRGFTWKRWRRRWTSGHPGLGP